MTKVIVEEFDVRDPHHGSRAALALRSPASPGPLCLFLYGGGGHIRNLEALAPRLQDGFDDGSIGPLTVVCLDVPPWCFYLDDPTAGMAWECAVADSLRVEALQRFHATGPVGLVGISMGGYGALKIALDRPHQFAAVAAIAPMLEPSVAPSRAPLRNRFHYPPECPPRLVGPDRDPELARQDHPVFRAQRNVEAIVAHDLGVYLDAGSRDALHAHDGAEFLHRVLWDLDIAHAYHLHRDADHVGASLLPRLCAGFSWVARALTRVSPPSEEEVSLRTALSAARDLAAREDPSTLRTYGRPDGWNR